MLLRLIHILKAMPALKLPDGNPEVRLVSCLLAHVHSWHAAPDVLQALPGEANSY